MKIVIYGAQGIALGTFLAMKETAQDITVDCFLVSKKEGNPSVLGGLPVYELKEFIASISEHDRQNVKVFICTPENVMDDIKTNLIGQGIYDITCIDSIKFSEMQKNAFLKNKKFVPLELFPIGNHKAQLHVFKMRHSLDKAISLHFKNPDYMIDLQVGAVKTEKRISKLSDDLGDNISERNGDYSELTGLYWVWKNFLSEEDMNHYCGLAHYRRLLDFSEKDLLRLLDNDIDVVLPYPMPYEPNIEAHHLRYLIDSEWNAVLQAVDELQPEYAVSFKEILKQGYYYNYNVILAKNNVLQDYCDWLFPLLFRIEEINDPEGIKPPNRFMGYVGETLETLYFMHNKDRLRITHTGCRFLM